MFQHANPYDLRCPSREVLDLVGSKWGLLLVCSLQGGPLRTGELQRSVGGISAKMLAQTLRELQRHGLVERLSHPVVPPCVEYRLSALGASLAEPLRAMEQWVVANYPAIVERRERFDALAA